MAESFAYDVFLSHSSKDKAVVRAIAERLKADGLRVWLDEWVLRPGHNIPHKIDEGLSREFNVSDHGIDMEIEFKSNDGEATGRKLYLQLKSGDSYLRKRKSDDAEIFTIKDERHARYWMAQKFPVLLVVRNSEGEVRWMEVRDWLKRASEGGKKVVKQVVFDGERFDVMSVRRWRDRLLTTALTPPAPP